MTFPGRLHSPSGCCERQQLLEAVTGGISLAFQRSGLFDEEPAGELPPVDLGEVEAEVVREEDEEDELEKDRCERERPSASKGSSLTGEAVSEFGGADS